MENGLVVFSFMLDTEYGVSEEQIIDLLKLAEDATVQLNQFIRNKQSL